MADAEDDMPRMSLAEHLDELRVRLWRCVLALAAGMIVSFVFYHDLMWFVRQPLIEAAHLLGSDAELIATDPGEGFLQSLKLCFICGTVFVSPIVLWQLWGFVSAGLYAHERRYVRVFFPISLTLFALGLVAAYVLLIPFGMRFLIGWNDALGIHSLFSLKQYLGLCLTMVFGMGIMFQVPLVMLFLQATGIVERSTFVKGWRFAVVLAFFLGMILTDPSPVTQIAMATPIVGLYFLGIWGGRFVGAGAERFRWWKAWPIVLALAIFVVMLLEADRLNDWAARAFGVGTRSEAPEK